MRKFMVITIPIVALSFFILIMVSDSYLKGSLGKDDNIPQAIEGIIDDISNERWEEAKRNTEEIEGLWRKIVKRVQFSAERDEINAFSFNIARLHGAIMAKDKAGALVELREAYEHWEELGK